MALVNDQVRTTVSGHVRNTTILSEGFAPGGEYAVTLRMPLYGEQGLASSLVPYALAGPSANYTPSVTKNNTMAEAGAGATGAPLLTTPPLTVDVPATTTPSLAQLPPRKPGPYTGLVVDGRGLDLQRSMQPKILRRDGTEVWGTLYVTTELVQSTGIVGFLPTLEAATDPSYWRSGTNPLIIRAVGRGGRYKADAVIENADAELVLAENAKTKFLDGFKVVFVVGAL
jgi:hypothetical protein